MIWTDIRRKVPRRPPQLLGMPDPDSSLEAEYRRLCAEPVRDSRRFCDAFSAVIQLSAQDYDNSAMELAAKHSMDKRRFFGAFRLKVTYFFAFFD
jgi:hypothetical protein